MNCSPRTRLWTPLAAVLSVTLVAGLAVAARQQSHVADSAAEHARKELAFSVPTDPPKGKVHWFVEWDEALNEAKLRNVPVLAVLADDGIGFKTCNDQTYSTKNFMQWSDKVVLLAAHDGNSHETEKRKVDGKDVVWCKLFDAPCELHLKAFKKVHELFAKTAYTNPLHLFLGPDGAELTRCDGTGTTLATLQEKEHVASKDLGFSLTFAEYRDLMKKLRGIVDAREKTTQATAHAELGKLIAAEPKDPKDTKAKRTLKTAEMVKFVEQLRTWIVEEGDGLVRDADLFVRKKDFATARKLLGEIVRNFKGLPPAAAADKALAELPAPDKK
jgi:hypothetical protein